jgi:energy-converting hydrogenase Eha subunit A
MRATRNPRVKICCISNLHEAAMAIEAGAAALGLVSNMYVGLPPLKKPAPSRHTWTRCCLIPAILGYR